MGILPIWGFQLAAAIAGAYALRLNKPLVILFANVSIPPNIPLILFLSYECGTLWTGKKLGTMTFSRAISLEAVRQDAFQYLSGSITLAVLAAVIFGSLTYLTLKAREYWMK